MSFAAGRFSFSVSVSIQVIPKLVKTIGKNCSKNHNNGPKSAKRHQNVANKVYFPTFPCEPIFWGAVTLVKSARSNLSKI